MNRSRTVTVSAFVDKIALGFLVIGSGNIDAEREMADFMENETDKFLRYTNSNGKDLVGVWDSWNKGTPSALALSPVKGKKGRDSVEVTLTLSKEAVGYYLVQFAPQDITASIGYVFKRIVDGFLKENPDSKGDCDTAYVSWESWVELGKPKDYRNDLLNSEYKHKEDQGYTLSVTTPIDRSLALFLAEKTTQLNCSTEEFILKLLREAHDGS